MRGIDFLKRVVQPWLFQPKQFCNYMMFSSLFLVGIKMDGCCQINPMSLNFYQIIKYSANSIAELVCCGCDTELSHLDTCLGSSPLQIQLLEPWEVSQSVRRSGYDHLPAPKQIKERAAVERW